MRTSKFSFKSEMTPVKNERICLCLNLIAAIAAFVSPAFAAGGTATVQPQGISNAQALTATVGGASVLPTTRTIPHWFGSTLNPQNGVVYGYNMVGADPNNCVGSACSVTIEVDITPLIVNVGGLTYSGNDVLAATLASPVFALNDYGSTPFSSAGGAGARGFYPWWRSLAG